MADVMGEEPLESQKQNFCMHRPLPAVANQLNHLVPRMLSKESDCLASFLLMHALYPFLSSWLKRLGGTCLCLYFLVNNLLENKGGYNSGCEPLTVLVVLELNWIFANPGRPNM